MIIETPKPKQILALRSLWQEAFGDTEQFLDDFFSTAYASDRCRCLTVDGELAAALYWFDCACRNQKIAYLYAIATGKAYRGQGLCRKLMENTHEHLRTLGYAGAILVPGTEDLFSFYQRGGYSVCSHIGTLCCSSSEEKIEIFPIDVEEYTRRRKKLLPQNGVLQEGENLRFLQTMATLYATDTALLAARREGDTLYGLELLGDPTQASAMVGALRCKKGTLRIPEGDLPFAMYYPLRGDVLPPSYFGLAFD